MQTDKWTNRRTFVNVELLLQLKTKCYFITNLIKCVENHFKPYVSTNHLKFVISYFALAECGKCNDTGKTVHIQMNILTVLYLTSYTKICLNGTRRPCHQVLIQRGTAKSGSSDRRCCKTAPNGQIYLKLSIEGCFGR